MTLVVEVAIAGVAVADSRREESGWGSRPRRLQRTRCLSSGARGSRGTQCLFQQWITTNSSVSNTFSRIHLLLYRYRNHKHMPFRERKRVGELVIADGRLQVPQLERPADARGAAFWHRANLYLPVPAAVANAVSSAIHAIACNHSILIQWKLWIQSQNLSHKLKLIII